MARSKSHMAPVAGALLVAGFLLIHASGGAAIVHGVKSVSGSPWAVVGIILGAIVVKAAWLVWIRRLHRGRSV